jgi:predicted nucleic acid-binding Zn ribbon protein
MNMVIRRSQARPIKDIIEDVLKASGIGNRLKERELIRQWEEVVGITIARSTESIYVRDRKLIVTVRSSVIRNELFMIREGLKTELNRRSGQMVIDEIIIK